VQLKITSSITGEELTLNGCNSHIDEGLSSDLCLKQ
jgi:hypothetical protein